MKNLNQFGVTELNHSETSEINGGNFWTTLGSIVGYIAGAFVVGLFFNPADYVN